MSDQPTGRPAGRPSGIPNKAGYKRKIFYLDGNLYKRLEVRRHENLCICWSFDDDKEVAFIWTDLKRKMRPAFTIGEAAKLCNRKTRVLQAALYHGKISKPKRTKSLNNAEGYKGVHMFSEEDVLAYLDYITFEAADSPGKKRKDGRTKRPRKGTPTKAEVLAQMRTGTVMYMKTPSGEFVPVWQEDAYL